MLHPANGEDEVGECHDGKIGPRHFRQGCHGLWIGTRLPATDSRDEDDMRLLEDEQQVMLAEIDAVAAQLQSAEARAAYAELRAAAEAGEVPDELLPPLERLVEIGLETGRIRQLHSA